MNQNKTTARAWFLKAANQGSAQGQFHNGEDGACQDLPEALCWLQLAANQANEADPDDAYFGKQAAQCLGTSDLCATVPRRATLLT